MRVTVDRERCSGHVRCAALAPEVYQLDEEGYAIADAQFVPAERQRAAERGALACPEQAIALTP
ncbi:ferredoxin [Micromonospora sp. NPDC049679]|uniref:ferredoxin n=1 Tax=Micromonospora sp. NPDC049679 TaxID=3155920 RepID=UPI0033FB0DC7